MGIVTCDGSNTEVDHNNTSGFHGQKHRHILTALDKERKTKLVNLKAGNIY